MAEGVRLPRRERFDAALMLADISGFTALTERLQARGSEGAEEITGVVEAAFRPAMGFIRRAGGSVVNFGGDAIFAVFPDQGAVHRAERAARKILDHFVRHGAFQTSVGAVRLRIRLVVHFGTVTGLHLGTRERRCFVVCGRPVAALVRLEEGAPAGGVTISRQAMRRRRQEAVVPARRRRLPRIASERLLPYVPAHLPAIAATFEGEYREAVILFLETKGCEMRRLQRFVKILHAALHVFGGILVSTDVSQVGVKWLCAFGAPVSHEDDPERAARVGLHLLRVCPAGLPLRGGFHAGTVANIWLGDRRRRSFELMGDVTNTAARTMAKAEFGEILVTDRTCRGLSGVETERKGAFPLKGKSEPVVLHRLKRERPLSRKLRVSLPLVGRVGEMEGLNGLLRSAAEGRGGLAGLEGGAGLGKSRLKWEIGKLAKEMGFAIHQGQSIAFGTGSYHAIAGLIRSCLGLSEEASREELLGRLPAECGRRSVSPAAVHHLADLLGVRETSSPLAYMDGKTIRRNNMLAIRAFFRGQMALGRQMLVMEDMHWADETTREAVEWLAKEVVGGSCLLLLLYRPGYKPPPETTVFRLQELGVDGVRGMLSAMLGRLAPATVELARQRAGGNPLYIEEMLRNLIASGVMAKRAGGGYRLMRELGPEDLPPGVEALIRARLDRLSPAGRNVAQVASVHGRTFRMELLAKAERSRPDLTDGVQELVGQELVFQARSRSGVDLTFKHALTRDVAYKSILVARRRRYHRAVAEAIEALYPDERPAYLVRLAHHWEQAGLIEKARSCYREAFRQAAANHSNVSAEQLGRHYLRLVERPSRESVDLRLEVGKLAFRNRGRVREQLDDHRKALEEARAIGDRYMVGHCLETLGVDNFRAGHPKMARALLLQARRIACECGDRLGEGVSLRDYAKVLLGQGRVKQATEMAEEALAIARETGDQRFEARVSGLLADMYVRAGRFREGRQLCEQSLQMARRQGDRYREGVLVAGLSMLCLHDGRLDQADRLCEESVAIAHEVGDPAGEGRALTNKARILMVEERFDEAGLYLELALSVHQEMADIGMEGHAHCLQGDLHLQQGRSDAALEAYDRALTFARNVEDPILEGQVKTGLARLERLALGRFERALDYVSEAEGLLAHAGDRVNLVCCLCEKGHVGLATGGQAHDVLAGVRSLLKQFGVSEESWIARRVRRFAAAVEAGKTGQPLHRGELVELLQPGLQRVLELDQPA